MKKQKKNKGNKMYLENNNEFNLNESKLVIKLDQEPIIENVNKFEKTNMQMMSPLNTVVKENQIDMKINTINEVNNQNMEQNQGQFMNMENNINMDQIQNQNINQNQLNSNQNIINELYPAKKPKFSIKAFFKNIIDEIKNIFAKEKETNIFKNKQAGFINPDDNKQKNINQNKNVNQNTNSTEVKLENKNIIKGDGILNNINKTYEEDEQNKNINIDLKQNVKEEEIVKRRAKHLRTDSLSGVLDLEDLSYYDLKLLYTELIK